MVIRDARPGDELKVARIHVRAWQAGYRGILPEDYLSGLSDEQRAARYTFHHDDPARPRTLIAEDTHGPVGFATTAPAEEPEVGELAALHVDPDAWRLGIGRLLLSAARSRLANHGHKAASLWLLAGNSRGDAFYRADGWKPDGTWRTKTVWGVQVDELRYRRHLP